MWVFIIILILIAGIAAYPFIRDLVKRQKTPLASYTEALCLILDGKEDEAIEKLKQTVTMDSNNVDAYLRLAELFIKKGETARAAKIFERLALRRNMSKEEEKKVYSNLANYYIKTDRIQRAISLLEELVNLDRNNIPHYERLLELYSKSERWQECEELLKKLEKIQTNKEQLSNYYLEIGKKLSSKNPEQSAKYLKQALAFNRKSVAALLTLGDYYYNKQEVETAVKIWNEILEYFPAQNSLVRSRLERAYYDLGQYEKVINLYEQLLTKIPEDISLYFALARIHLKKDEIDNAIKIINRMPFDKRKDTLPQIALATLYLKLNDIDKTKSILENLFDNLIK
ncbi:MAG: tetratricopeptide repeat protein [candidate division WOR-3 bacterium]|nr:tetratricopeptide repeat protein [candidate division WOR-3 bacterium]